MKLLFLLALVSLAFTVGGVTRANHEPYQLERIEMDPNPSPAVVEGHLKKLPGAAQRWMYPGAKVNGLHESGPSQAYPKGNALISMRTPDSPDRKSVV